MIARFYNKFDELHEQSVQQALAKGPNKMLVKNEIKYKIPERWTKPFHKHDIIGKILQDENINQEERGRVNRQGILTTKQRPSGQWDGLPSYKHTESMQEAAAHGELPFSNTALHADSKFSSSPIQNQKGKRKIIEVAAPAMEKSP